MSRSPAQEFPPSALTTGSDPATVIEPKPVGTTRQQRVGVLVGAAVTVLTATALAVVHLLTSVS